VGPGKYPLGSGLYWLRPRCVTLFWLYSSIQHQVQECFSSCATSTVHHSEHPRDGFYAGWPQGWGTGAMEKSLLQSVLRCTAAWVHGPTEGGDGSVRRGGGGEEPGTYNFHLLSYNMCIEAPGKALSLCSQPPFCSSAVPKTRCSRSAQLQPRPHCSRAWKRGTQHHPSCCPPPCLNRTGFKSSSLPHSPSMQEPQAEIPHPSLLCEGHSCPVLLRRAESPPHFLCIELPRPAGLSDSKA